MNRVEAGLYVGDADDATAYDRLREAGVETVVSLTHGAPEKSAPDRLTRHEVPMKDGPRNDYEAFQRAVETLLDALDRDGATLVHCSAGASRSVAVAAAALAGHSDLSVAAALARIEERRPEARPHPALVSRAERFAAERGD